MAHLFLTQVSVPLMTSWELRLHFNWSSRLCLLGQDGKQQEATKFGGGGFPFVSVLKRVRRETQSRPAQVVFLNLF